MDSEFISELRKRETDKLLKELSQLSISMYRSGECFLPIHRILSWRRKTSFITAWDLVDIAYYSVIKSNDFRSSKKIAPIEQLICFYQKYANEHSVASRLRTSDISGIFKNLLGMTAEQFQFQDLSWVFEKLNRDYFILYSSDFQHRKIEKPDIEAIIQQEFNLSIEDFILVFLLIWWLSTQNPEPILAYDMHSSELGESEILSKENVLKLIQYYSCNYKELRESPMGRQLLYSKPFILTDRTRTFVATSTYLVAMALGNSLYWLIRDFYRKKNSQYFINGFGYLFEDYVTYLSRRYCKDMEWKALKPSNKKGSDFLYNFEKIQMIVECKTTLLRLEAKQQVPQLDRIDTFFKQTIQEAYEQLQSSYQQYKNKSKPTIKVILLYDQFSDVGVMEQSAPEIFQNDLDCFIMTIREFEIFLHLHHTNDSKFNTFVDRLYKQRESSAERISVSAVLESLSIRENQHIKTMDFLASTLYKFGDEVRPKNS